MDFNLSLILSAALFFTSILVNLPSLTTSDSGECPYPCYPPPTGTGTPIVTTPPSPPSQSAGTFSPPLYPSPTGNLPYYYPPPAFANNFNSPPPPDPILPYFPFYYRKPPHQGDVSSATSLPSKNERKQAAILTYSIDIVDFAAHMVGKCYYRQLIDTICHFVAADKE
ncbi:hypothetical protein POTOM_036026 [Populus tomentosa]|uniref:Hydroxyproline-rich glycoprotein family protein n=1 Tax=Populus tomentosa TaxID=118781 RepID=A0A8X8CML6_POPTO|nr:hypothetical protein POTOM_036026 [Populus tomentosa]